MFFTHDKSACKHRTWAPENLHTGRNFHQLIFQWPKVLFQSTKAHFLHSTFWKFPFMLHSPLIKYINIIFLQCRYIYTFLGDASFSRWKFYSSNICNFVDCWRAQRWRLLRVVEALLIYFPHPNFPQEDCGLKLLTFWSQGCISNLSATTLPQQRQLKPRLPQTNILSDKIEAAAF